MLTFLALLFVIYALASSLVVTTVRVESRSMTPTVEPGDRLLIIPMLYGPRLRVLEWTGPGFSEPRRGDLVLLRAPYLEPDGIVERLFNPFVRFFTAHTREIDSSHVWEHRRQTKRIVGLPGDTVRVDRFVVYIRPEGETTFRSEIELAERAYAPDIPELPSGWPADGPFAGTMEPVTLGSNEYFVAGDNRGASVDSRAYGPVTKDDITGRIVLRYWPLGAFGVP